MSSTSPGLVDLLSLERIEADLFRTCVVFDDPYGLYGGQVAAQALRAAAETVPDGRQPHSLHGYFLSPGDASRPVLLTVYRDRDGRSYSNRRVVAIQNGIVIFNLAASFHVSQDGSDYQARPMPEVAGPEGVTDRTGEFRLRGIDVRIPGQDGAGRGWPMQVWMRSQDKLGDEIMHACALTYVSDMFTGLAHVPGIENVGRLTTLDHAVWFYRPAVLDDWVLMDLEPVSTAGGRGMYTGRIFTKDGTLAAGIAQESLFRPRHTSTG